MVANRPQNSETPVGINNARAKWAWDRVNQVTSEAKGVQSRYSTLVRRLPSMLQTSGLGQTMAFLFSQSKFGSKDQGLGDQAKGSRLLYQHLADRIEPKQTDAQRAMARIVNMSPDEYRQMGRELQSVAEWLKRFGEGRLATEE